MLHERISINPNICHGQACIRGTRIPVHLVIKLLANRDSIEDVLKAYPALVAEDIYACLDYAAELAEENVKPLDSVG